MIHLAYTTIFILFLIIICLLTALANIQKRYHEHVVNIQKQNNNHERNYFDFIEDLQITWDKERSELLDRVQAPTFAEYKQAEVRMVKAQKDEEPRPSFILE